MDQTTEILLLIAPSAILALAVVLIMAAAATASGGGDPREPVRRVDRGREALPEVRHGQPLDRPQLHQLQGADLPG